MWWILDWQDIDLEALQILNVCYERAKEVPNFSRNVIYKHYTKPFLEYGILISLFLVLDFATKQEAHGCSG